MRALAIALGLIATPALAADQFDLDCKSKGDGRHYRIDLATSEFCEGDCRLVTKIASVTSGTLLLSDEKPVAGGDEIRNQIDRSSGAWVYYRRLPRTDFSKLLTGTCSVAPFSGFPSPKF